MGSHLLDGMTRAGRYSRVVALLGDSAGGGGAVGVGAGSLQQVADVTLDASVKGLEHAKGDDGLAYCFYLLVQISRASRRADFLTELANVGVIPPAAISGLPDIPIPVKSTDLTVFDLTSGFCAEVDRQLLKNRGRTDIGELAELSAAESLSILTSRDGELLFPETGAHTLQESLRALSTKNGFMVLAHDFFARLIRRYLEYHLSRELPNHVGPGRRFATAEAHNEFLRELDEHCRISTSVMRTFAGDWYSLHNFKDDVSVARAKGFVAHAIDKVRGALVYQEGHEIERGDHGAE